MFIRPATPRDLGRILDIYAYARRRMAKAGNLHQWGMDYPPRELVQSDIAQGCCYVGVDRDDAARFVFALFGGADPTYQAIEDGAWPNEAPYLTIHRVASDGTVHKTVATCLNYAERRALELGVHDIRIDTHEDNAAMRHVLAGLGFARCGIIHLENGDARIAYQLTFGTDAAAPEA